MGQVDPRLTELWKEKKHKQEWVLNPYFIKWDYKNILGVYNINGKEILVNAIQYMSDSWHEKIIKHSRAGIMHIMYINPKLLALHEAIYNL